MKDELKKLAEEKGFKSRFTAFTPTGDVALEVLMFDFWMFELQKWLRKNRGINILIDFKYIVPIAYDGIMEEYVIVYIPTIYIFGTQNEYPVDGGNPCSTYEEALEKGIIQSLNIIE